jgi:hypothetical protein
MEILSETTVYIGRCIINNQNTIGTNGFKYK